MAELEGEARQRYVADLFTRIAGRYDLMNDLMTVGQHRWWKEQTARITASGLRGRSLDIATGTGDLALALARRPEIEHSVGIDLLPRMIALGAAKAQTKGLTNRTTLLVGDALQLPFSDGSFACATAGFSLRNMPDLPRALAEMVRVVEAGGRITTLELSPMQSGLKSGLFRLVFRQLFRFYFHMYFHRLVPLLGQLISGDRSAYTYLPQSVDYFLEADRLADLFRNLGLVEVGYKRLGMGTVTLHWGQRPEI